MRVLLLAPHPFYQERGTPIAVDLLLRALSERGDEVDLLTFHEGEGRDYPGLRLHRIRPWFRIRDIPPGFSAKKLLCDAHLFWRFLRLLKTQRYDVVHAVEESAFMAWLACPWRRLPFVYDMDSCMTTQLVDKFTFLRPLRGMLDYIESLPMRRAAAVVPVCEALARQVRRYRSDNVVILKDISLLEDMAPVSEVPDVRRELGIEGPLAMYIGNLESYQGIDLMLESFAIVKDKPYAPHLVVIGGAPGHVTHYEARARQLGAAHCVHFLGQRPVRHMAGYLRQADILLSPRTQGVNTPMKVYSYLHSGRALLATRLPTHTQVMDDEIAMLAAPESASFAAAMDALLADEALRARLARRARAFIEAEHSYDAFRRQVHALYQHLEAQCRAS